MTKHFVTMIALLAFLNAAPFGQSPAPDNASTEPQDIAHVRRLKKQAVRLADGEYVRVEKQDRAVVIGRLVDVSDSGVKVMPLPQKQERGSPSPRTALQQQLIPFDQIHELQRWTKPENDFKANTFGAGVFLGLLGPLGWFGTFAMATGRD